MREIVDAHPAAAAYTPEALSSTGFGRIKGPESVKAQIRLVTVMVADYDQALEFFTGALDFELVEDSPAISEAGAAKRWVVVRPRGAATGILLARATGAEQRLALGAQTPGRVGFFLEVDDFDSAHQRLRDAGVEFVGLPRSEPYGRVVVFLDLSGNRWDLIGPR